MRCASAILPPEAQETPKVTEVLPLLYLHDLSSGEFVPAGLGQFLGLKAGLSAAARTRSAGGWMTASAVRDLVRALHRGRGSSCRRS
jgi:hypothetical protein